MIRGIEHLHAELQSMLLIDAEILQRGEVHVPCTGPDQVVPPAVAELSGDGVVETLANKIPIGRRVIRYWIQAGAIQAEAVWDQCQTRRVPRGGVDRRSTLHCRDRADLPAA